MQFLTCYCTFRKDRDGARHSPHSGDSSWWPHSCARLLLPPNLSCEPLTFCIIASFTSLILAVAALAYFTSTLHAKINYLNIQLKNGEYSWDLFYGDSVFQCIMSVLDRARKVAQIRPIND